MVAGILEHCLEQFKQLGTTFKIVIFKEKVGKFWTFREVEVNQKKHIVRFVSVIF